MSYSDLGRMLKLAGVLFFIVWISVLILLSLLSFSVDASLNTVMILFGIGMIALGFIVDFLSEGKI